MFVCYATLPRHFEPRAAHFQGFIYDPHGRVIYDRHGRVATVFFFYLPHRYPFCDKLDYPLYLLSATIRGQFVHVL